MTTDTERQAQEARELLDHPMLKGAFDGLREATVQAIEDNPMTDELLRDKLMITLQVIRDVRAQLQSYVDSHAIQKAQENEE